MSETSVPYAPGIFGVLVGVPVMEFGWRGRRIIVARYRVHPPRLLAEPNNWGLMHVEHP